MPDLSDVVIVGGGIIGASLAWELSRKSLRVTLLEAGQIANGATGQGFAWINATAKWEDETYHRLNAKGMAHFDTLVEKFGAERLGLCGGGALFWTQGDSSGQRERLRQCATRLQNWGYPAALLDCGEMRALEPKVNFADDAEGFFAPSDRWLDAPRCTRLLLELAGERGADIRENCPATGFTHSSVSSISTVETPQGRIATRLLVLAAGAWTPQLVAQVNHSPAGAAQFPMQYVPGLLVETPAGSASGFAHRVLYPSDAGGLHLRPTPGGGLLIGADDIDAALLENNRPPLSDPERKDAVNALLERVIPHLPELPLAALKTDASARICTRPVPLDDRPIIGPLGETKGVYLAVTHSGITLGPFLASLLAEEIVNGRISPLLTSYRPARFRL